MAPTNPATWISPRSSSDSSESPIIRMEHSRYSTSKYIKGSSQTREFS